MTRRSWRQLEHAVEKVKRRADESSGLEELTEKERRHLEELGDRVVVHDDRIVDVDPDVRQRLEGFSAR